MPVDLLLYGGAIETMDSSGARAEAAAVREGRFVAVGSLAEVEAWAGPETRRIDLRGGALLPGFRDTHMHLQKIARELAMVHLDTARSIDDVLGGVAQAAAGAPPGEWVQSFGDDGAWHERQLTERRLPDRAELDRAAPSHPVFLFRGPDAVALNSLAAQALAEPLAGPFAVEWEPTSGHVRSARAKALQRLLPPPDPARDQEYLRKASRALLRMGITSVVDPGLPATFAESWQLYQTARRTGDLLQRVYLMNRFDYRRSFGDEMSRLASGPALPLDGDEFVRAWAVKLLLDGEFVDAWMRTGEPAAGEPTRRYSARELDDGLTKCGAHGWPLCVHALGGGAIDFVIERMRHAVARGLRFYPGQLSLAHAFFPSPKSLEACRELGITLAVQPLLMYVFEREMEAAWGDFAARATPLASILAAGVRVAGGSDVLPCEPLRGARMAVERRARHGFKLDASEAVTPRQALELFTRHAGLYVGRDDMGRIAPGCVADFVVWSANPLRTPLEGWLGLEVSLAAVAGRIN
jgi:predicted amidohydrolase YtcJ